jgi:hypothetical protein
MILRWLGFALGVALILVTTASVVGALVVPRGVSSVISRTCDSAVDRVFRAITMPVRTYARRDAILAWQSPVFIVSRLATWIALFYLGFAFVLMPFVPGHVGHAFAESGSSMFTLGYASPGSDSSTVIDLLAAFTGLIVVGLQIGYLPTLYSAFNRRETEVTLLISRAGIPAWGPELLARTRYGIVDGYDSGAVLEELFQTWERWSAEVAESHTTYTTLARLRSPRPLSHWLTSILAIMDAAAFHLSIAPSIAPGISARLCLRMGFVAMQQIGGASGLVYDEDPDPDGPLEVSWEEFEAAYDMLAALDYPIERTAAEAWPHFRGWRVNYEGVALALAKAVDAPPALWSGSRRWPSVPMPPGRPANRLATGAVPHKPARPVADGQPRSPGD